MYILAIETTGKEGSVCLVQKDEGGGEPAVLGEKRIEGSMSHLKELIPSISSLLESQGVSKNEISYIAASVGPDLSRESASGWQRHVPCHKLSDWNTQLRCLPLRPSNIKSRPLRPEQKESRSVRLSTQGAGRSTAWWTDTLRMVRIC